MTELEYQVATAVLKERERCAEVAQIFPFQCYRETEDHREVLRLRNDISQAIRLNLPPGQALP